MVIMKAMTTVLVASLAGLAAAAKNERTFAVLRFDGDGFMTEGRVDPIVSPGTTASHYHGIMGGDAFGTTVKGDQLLSSKCTSAKIKNDKSNYWIPNVFFRDPKNGTFTKVPLFYMNVYYFFEPTDDEIKPFPVGLKMFIGDAATRDPPAFGGGSNLNPGAGPVQPIQFTCPRSSYNPPSYPAGSDGKSAGMQDPGNKGAGAGFPLYPCDGYASPLRSDIHFPSCYNPKAGLEDYKNNMAWPTVKNGKQNCPAGWTHVPHIFFENYWNTPLFDKLWTPDGKTQPFVLSNGDATGYSLHADFISGWDENTLQTIINTCNKGSEGMDKCPQIPGGLNDNKNCKLAPPVKEAMKMTDALTALPGNNPLSGWSFGKAAASSAASQPAPSSSSPAESGPKASVDSSAKPTGTVAATSSSPQEKPTSAGVVNHQASSSAGAAGGSPYSGSGSGSGSDPQYSTVWNVVTETHTNTAYVEQPTAYKRADHQHLARHRRSGRFFA